MSKRESVTVQGSGAVAATPDVLRLDLGIECRGPTVDAALTEANTAMSAVQRSLLSSGVPQIDLRTSDLSIHTEYDHQGRRVAGFVVSQGLRVIVRDLSAAGGLVSAAAAAGGDSTRVNGLRLDVEDDAVLLTEARQRAVADARARAETYAAAAQRSVGRALRITEGSSFEPVPARARLMAADAAGVPMQAGSHEVSVTVTVEWALD
jgi:uncharacterized protein YggE